MDGLRRLLPDEQLGTGLRSALADQHRFGIVIQGITLWLFDVILASLCETMA
jgi:hypothetical protein